MTTITLPREAAERTLVVLEHFSDHERSDWHDESITVLRAALAEDLPRLSQAEQNRLRSEALSNKGVRRG